MISDPPFLNHLPLYPPSEIPLSPLRKPLSPIQKPFFTHFDQSFSEAIFGKTRRDFEKPKEVFSHHGPNNNNLSHISHIITYWENQEHL
jgi:hypothetical protein